MKSDINSIANSVDPDQLASSGSPLFSKQHASLKELIQFNVRDCINFIYTCLRTSK